MLKLVAVLLCKLHAEVNDLRRSTGDLDGVGLDVCHRETTLLYFVLQSAHKQSATQGDNVVRVLRITERIIKGRACQTVHRVDGDLQCLC